MSDTRPHETLHVFNQRHKFSSLIHHHTAWDIFISYNIEAQSFLLINFFFDFASWPEVSLPSPPISSFTSLFFPSKATPTPPLFRKEQVSHGYQQSMSYQVEIGLHFSPSSKAGQGNPALKTGSQKPAKAFETGPDPIAKSPKSHNHNRYAEDLGRFHVGYLDIGS